MLTQTTLEPDITDGMNTFERALKRLFDVVIAALGLICLSPLMLLIAVAIRWEDGGPVIFKQERIGRGGRPFFIYKYRTMHATAEEAPMTQFPLVDEARVTAIGARLRRYHIDELPQLLNVLQGDMSLVGPRPERQYYINKIMERNPDYRYIYRMRPGATSMATLYNGYTDTLEKMLIRLQMDLDYYRHRSLYMDAKILFTTAKSIIFGKQF